MGINKTHAMLDNLQMDYHWRLIRLYRDRARRLIDKGTPCNDTRLVNLSSRILRHGIAVSRIWRSSRNPLSIANTDPVNKASA